MKKKQIGFLNINESKTKVADDTEGKDQHTENETIPPHIIDEIEGHVLAKQEYEKSMHTLYVFKSALKIILILFTIVILGGIFYAGYKYGQNITIENYKKQQEIMNTFNAVYQLGVLDGMNYNSEKK